MVFKKYEYMVFRVIGLLLNLKTMGVLRLLVSGIMCLLVLKLRMFWFIF